MQIKNLWFLFLVGLILKVPHEIFAADYKVKIIQPKSRAKVQNPFKICMEVEGLTVEPADKKRIDGKGHHHILSSSLPADLNKPGLCLPTIPMRMGNMSR